MLYDNIPLPSKGLFYEGQLEFVKVFFMTTEDELMLTAPNIFNQGSALRILLEKTVCEPNNLPYNQLLINDKEFLLLYLKENAYGHIVDYQDKDRIYFDTRNIEIKNIELFPDDGIFYTYHHKNDIIKLKNLKVTDEKFLKCSKLENQILHIHSINGDEDRKHIKFYMEYMPILESRPFRNYIDSIDFGLNKQTFCHVNEVKQNITIQVDESLFGLTQENLGKFNKNVNDTISFLLNEGNGYTMEGILKLPVHVRKFHEENLVKKITKLNDSMK